MKKKMVLIAMLVLIIVSIIPMVGCGASSNNNTENDSISIYAVDISEEKRLVYDTDTGIVYIQQRTYNGYTIYTLYLSENGLPYKYENGELIEVKYEGQNYGR